MNSKTKEHMLAEMLTKFIREGDWGSGTIQCDAVHYHEDGNFYSVNHGIGPGFQRLMDLSPGAHQNRNSKNVEFVEMQFNPDSIFESAELYRSAGQKQKETFVFDSSGNSCTFTFSKPTEEVIKFIATHRINEITEKAEAETKKWETLAKDAGISLNQWQKTIKKSDDTDKNPGIH